MKHYAGLDISMKTTFITIVDQDGKIVAEQEVVTDPVAINSYLLKTNLKLEEVGLETGSLSRWLVQELKKYSLPVVCIDARKMAAVLSINPNKTDKNDARGIADAMRCKLYRKAFQKSDVSSDTLTLVRTRRTLVQQRTQLKNTVRGFLKSYGIRLGSVGAKQFSALVRKRIADQADIYVESIEALLQSYNQLIVEIEKLEKRMKEIAKADEKIQQLMTIPGVGAITALAYRAEIDDPERFEDSRDVGAYLGMTPRQYSSGETIRQGRVSKCGSKEVRYLLYEAGLVLLTRTKKWSRLKAWGLKICRKHGMKKAALAVGRKLAVMMHRMLLTGETFRYGEQKKAKV